MKLKGILLAIAVVFTALPTFAQANILNAKHPDEIGLKTEIQRRMDHDKPLTYDYVDDRDILFSKMVWEKIPLSERVNYPLYYPIDTVEITKSRRSLYDVLIKNIKNGKIKNIYGDAYFTTKRTLQDIQAALVKIDTTSEGIEQLNAGEQLSQEYIDKRHITAADIVEYRIRGLWYFDKHDAEMKYRLLAIAPVAPDVNFIDTDSPDLVPLFWVFFPEARQTLYDAKVFNTKNSAVPLSFDELLSARRFNAVIYKEENIQGDRAIQDYIHDNALKQLIEGQRIKESIRNSELDMWSY